MSPDRIAAAASHALSVEFIARSPILRTLVASVGAFVMESVEKDMFVGRAAKCMIDW